MSSKTHSEENAVQHIQAGEVEISYQIDDIVSRLQRHQINPKDVYTHLSVDIDRLFALKPNSQKNHYLIALFEAIRNWGSGHNLESFTDQLNQLIFLWLNAVDTEADKNCMLDLLKCFQLNQLIGFSKTFKFHLFLHELVIETLQAYHQLTLNYTLNYDGDLKLPNANQIIPDIDAIRSQASDDHLTALLSLHFQAVNSNFLLPKLVSQSLNRQLANKLKHNISENSQLYFSGDAQFEILITRIQDTVQLDLLIAKISRAFEEMVFISKQPILMTPYIGSAYTKATSNDVNQIYQQAKQALEQAITKRQQHVVFTNTLQQSIDKQIDLESKILAAFDSNNFSLNLQPIIALEDAKCVGAELLLRWSDKFGENISPGFAIETLNNVGKGKLFTRWLINSTCRYVHELTEVHQLDLYLTINLRAEDLYDHELPSLFNNALSLWKLNPEHIVLEITESGILEHNDITSTVINTLSEIGFKFALDDFGTGFSSLTRLRTLPIDLIKIDQSFVRNINESKEDYKIVESIAMLANSLGKQVLAEGVEDQECLQLINKLNIDKCQGFYFAKALPYDEFVSWVQEN